uniref:Acetylserotonin O-methyltransferase n=1 Tax=Marmota marmota marmota TaxID=9994 RepID=A0A8C6EPC3_MARMA
TARWRPASATQQGPDAPGHQDTLAFPQVLFAACELGLFDLLAEAPGPLDVAAISEGLGASPWGTELLLEACVPLRLLDVDTRGGTARYANSELARAYLTSRSPTGQRAMLRYLGVGADPLSEPDQRRPAPRSPAERLQFTRGLQEIWSVDGRRVLTAFDLSPFHRICDLGGGAGALAQECACVYPGCHVTVLEVPEVVQTARAHLPLQTEGQVGFREGRCRGTRSWGRPGGSPRPWPLWVPLAPAAWFLVEPVLADFRVGGRILVPLGPGTYSASGSQKSPLQGHVAPLRDMTSRLHVPCRSQGVCEEGGGACARRPGRAAGPGLLGRRLWGQHRGPLIELSPGPRVHHLHPSVLCHYCWSEGEVDDCLFIYLGYQGLNSGTLDP